MIFKNEVEKILKNMVDCKIEILITKICNNIFLINSNK